MQLNQTLQKIDFSKIFMLKNRGILLDVVVFFINLILLTVLARLFGNLMRAGNSKEDIFAQWAMILFCLGLAFLQSIGAILRRRSAHQRHPDLDTPEPTILFHPIFYFLSKLLFLIAAGGKIVDLAYAGESSGSADYFGLPPWLFTTLFLGIPGLAIANTAIVYFYFWKPTHQPLFNFLQSPQAETLGDICLFLNMIGYQMFWSFVMVDLTKDYSGIGSRLFMFGFTALLIYFPPRIFYLAEDAHRPLTWLTMLLANSPIILRIFFAGS